MNKTVLATFFALMTTLSHGLTATELHGKWACNGGVSENGGGMTIRDTVNLNSNGSYTRFGSMNIVIPEEDQSFLFPDNIDVAYEGFGSWLINGNSLTINTTKRSVTKTNFSLISSEFEDENSSETIQIEQVDPNTFQYDMNEGEEEDEPLMIVCRKHA